MRDWAQKDSCKNTFNKSPHTDTRMPLSNKRPKPSQLKHAGMQEFFFFEPSLIRSKYARSPGPCAHLAPATRAHRRAAGIVAVDSEKATTSCYAPEALLGSSR